MFMQVSLPVYYCIILFAIVQDEYGIDWDSPSGVDDEGIVEIPETECPLTGPQFEELKHQLNPLEPCDDYGISLYTAAKAFVDNI